jgi:hypothetical protein
VLSECGVAVARKQVDCLDQEAESLLRRDNHAQDVVGAVRISEQSQATTLLGSPHRVHAAHEHVDLHEDLVVVDVRSLLGEVGRFGGDLVWLGGRHRGLAGKYRCRHVPPVD